MQGAGAIFYISLVQEGWKFPTVQISDEDDLYLFEIEVISNLDIISVIIVFQAQLKLGKLEAFFNLKDVVYDFPPEVLLQRTSLLEEIMNIIGSVLSADEKGFPDSKSLFSKISSSRSRCLLVSTI
jgi:hypothetical protein